MKCTESDRVSRTPYAESGADVGPDGGAWFPVQPAGADRRQARYRKRRGARIGTPASPLQAAVCGLLTAHGGRAREADVRFVLQSMSDAFSEGLALLDHEARLVYVNDSLCRMLGRTAREILGRAAADVLGERVARPGEAGQAGTGWYRCELEIELAGGPRVVQMAAHPLRTVRWRDIGCFAVFTDVTARAKVEAALRRSESDLRLLSAQLIAAQELERQRIARELHDGIGQALGAVKCGLEICEAQLGRGARRGELRRLRALGDDVRRIVEEVRRIAMNLRPATLDDLGVLATLGWFFREFAAHHAGIQLRTVVEAAEPDVAPQAKTALYRIVQEALSNVVRHARARTAEVSLQRVGMHLQLGVRDDGAGFNPSRFAAVHRDGRGLGLASMRERAEASGGRFSVQSTPGGGSQILVSWPVHRAEVTRSRSKGAA